MKIKLHPTTIKKASKLWKLFFYLKLRFVNLKIFNFCVRLNPFGFAQDKLSQSLFRYKPSTLLRATSLFKNQIYNSLQPAPEILVQDSLAIFRMPDFRYYLVLKRKSNAHCVCILNVRWHQNNFLK